MRRLILILLAVAGPAFAADHTDNPAVVLEPSTDITDVFAFVTGKKQKRATLVLNTFLGAGPNARFSDAAKYELHFFRLDKNHKPLSTDGEFIVGCKFSSDTKQRFQCTLTTVDGRKIADASGHLGEVKGVSDFRIFAGRRRDPFYLAANMVSKRRTPKVADDFRGQNDTEFNDILTITAAFSTNLLPNLAKQPLYGVYAQVVMDRKVGPKTVQKIIDRMGRPEITNVTMRLDDVKFLWNHEKTLSLSDRRALYEKTIQEGVQLLDGLDGSSYWSPETLPRLVQILLDDYIWIDMRQALPVSAVRFLTQESQKLAGQPIQAAGGRGLDDDIIDIMLTYYMNGGKGVSRGDGVDRPAVKASEEFPFQHPPFLP